jgi:nucleoside-diphosphate-sugar epimerase
MKIYITGATGFLGLSFVDHYKENNMLFCHARGSDPIEELDTVKPDLILHCAGEIYDNDLMFDTNIGMTHTILEWVRNNPNTRMIYIGSSSEYGQVNHATKETDPINPIDIYQATKGAASLLCQGYSRYYKLHVAVARIYSGYGVHERERRLYPTLFRASYKNEAMTLRDGVHDFIYINDFLRGIDCLLAKEWPHGEIVNFGSGQQTSNLEVVEIWNKITGLESPITYESGFMKHYDNKIWCCDTSYAQSQYGFKTEYSLEEGIKDFIKQKHDRN